MGNSDSQDNIGSSVAVAAAAVDVDIVTAGQHIRAEGDHTEIAVRSIVGHFGHIAIAGLRMSSLLGRIDLRSPILVAAVEAAESVAVAVIVAVFAAD